MYIKKNELEENLLIAERRYSELLAEHRHLRSQLEEVFELLITVRNSKDAEVLQDAIDLVAILCCKNEEIV